ncbi:50S ribosomal protein L10 [Oceanibacterium hippocampi]|uniref:Large ribosomal subunit protein uL10 n=1 Tax=Oceanibacterium hippocampi TaxID=745714 RepID=A0A1Y5SG46_9PROT|nr:50S ribosomal protein L10 [Oceanibacterium hippocampi]SLN40023.1 50S ribosomal protein L10 [Oceanibacterium hippocampi]
MNRDQKADWVRSLNAVFEQTAAVVVTHYSGMTVAEVNDLRREMRKAGAQFKVTKNRLTRLALDGTPYQGMEDLFKGPTAIAYSDDPVSASKVAVAYAKKNERLVILGGAMGATKLDAEGVKQLATMPSLDELRGKIVGLLQAPATKLAGVIQAPASQLARVIDARAKQSEAA